MCPQTMEMACVPKPWKWHGLPSTTPGSAGAARPVQLQSSAVTCLTMTMDHWLSRGLAPAAAGEQSAKLSEAFPQGTTFMDSNWPPGHGLGGLPPSFLTASLCCRPGSVVSLTVQVPLTSIGLSVCLLPQPRALLGSTSARL